ncbi:thermonuclease family protein [Lysinibacillus piscis]|uniref:TNase-like domain-containing protein n=1 Tax=Lysinibacillus piscis TaxID=2518931 RepID=A0ABQ5NI03_9BACI|nr:thermonuclease family protein [Lysinibacillus sp. KH24]GLC87711.1 hypothetical protein LYSBPC_08380 [Lysinibacillus sp. KH24]
MKMQDVKTLITSGTIIIAVALYMIFSGPSEKEKDDTTTDNSQQLENVSSTTDETTATQQPTISMKQVEEKTGNQHFPVAYLKNYDGDTLQVNVNGEKRKIRLLMIDTPEMNYNKGEAQPYAQEAKDFTDKLLKNATTIEAVYDVGPETDNYERLLAYVFVDGKLLQESLLEEGFAAVRFIHKPNNTFEQELRDIQEKAETAKLNIWSHENYLQKDGFHPEVMQ